MNKQRFTEEVKKILKNFKKMDKYEFETLFKVANDEIKIANSVDFCDRLVKKMFGTICKEEIVPWKFFDTEIGKAIIKIKYGQNTDIFFVREIADFMGKTRQYINQEIKSGKLKAYKRCGTFIIYRRDLEEYLYKKDMDKSSFYKEIEEKIIIPENEVEEKYNVKK